MQHGQQTMLVEQNNHSFDSEHGFNQDPGAIRNMTPKQKEKFLGFKRQQKIAMTKASASIRCQLFDHQVSKGKTVTSPSMESSNSTAALASRLRQKNQRTFDQHYNGSQSRNHNISQRLLKSQTNISKMRTGPLSHFQNTQYFTNAVLSLQVKKNPSFKYHQTVGDASATMNGSMVRLTQSLTSLVPSSVRASKQVAINLKEAESLGATKWLKLTDGKLEMRNRTMYTESLAARPRQLRKFDTQAAVNTIMPPAGQGMLNRGNSTGPLRSSLVSVMTPLRPAEQVPHAIQLQAGSRHGDEVDIYNDSQILYHVSQSQDSQSKEGSITRGIVQKMSRSSPNMGFQVNYPTKNKEQKLGYSCFTKSQGGQGPASNNFQRNQKSVSNPGLGLEEFRAHIQRERSLENNSNLQGAQMLVRKKLWKTPKEQHLRIQWAINNQKKSRMTYKIPQKNLNAVMSIPILDLHQDSIMQKDLKKSSERFEPTMLKTDSQSQIDTGVFMLAKNEIKKLADKLQQSSVGSSLESIDCLKVDLVPRDKQNKAIHMIDASAQGINNKKEEYFIDNRYDQAVQFLDEEGVRRRNQDPVGQRVAEIAQANGLSFERVRDDLASYMDKVKVNSIKDDHLGRAIETFSPSGKYRKKTDLCLITSIERAANNNYEKNDRIKKCDHQVTTQERELQFLQSYERVHNYTMILQAATKLENILDGKVSLKDEQIRAKLDALIGLVRAPSLDRLDLPEDDHHEDHDFKSTIKLLTLCNDPATLTEAGQKLVNAIEDQVQKEVHRLSALIEKLDDSDPRFIAKKTELLRQLNEKRNLSGNGIAGKSLQFTTIDELLIEIEGRFKRKFLRLSQVNQKEAEALELLSQEIVNSLQQFRINFIFRVMRQAQRKTMHGCNKQYVIRSPTFREAKEEEEKIRQLDARLAGYMQSYITAKATVEYEISQKKLALVQKRGNKRVSAINLNHLFITENVHNHKEHSHAHAHAHPHDHGAHGGHGDHGGHGGHGGHGTHQNVPEEDEDDSDCSHAHSEEDVTAFQDLFDDSRPVKGQGSVLRDYEETQDFYGTAKLEVQGLNKPATLNSKFYNYCRAQGVLPFPVHKYISGNSLNLSSKTIGIGYARALASMLAENQDPGLHILHLHLHDCCMKDQELSCLLWGVLRSKKFNLSLQSFTYTNSSMGSQSIQALRELLSQQSSLTRLKDLTMSNVAFESPQDLRDFASLFGDSEEAGGLAPPLSSLALSNINLACSHVADSFSSFVATNSTLRQLMLSSCNLTTQQMTSLLEGLSGNPGIRSLDLSNNTLTSQEQSSLAFVDKLQIFLEGADVLEKLNLSGMQIGHYIVHILPTLIRKERLEDIDLSHNHFGSTMRDQIMRVLGVCHTAHLHAQNLLLDRDQFLLQSWMNFKSTHIAQLLSNYSEAKKIVGKIINSSILRTAKTVSILEQSKKCPDGQMLKSFHISSNKIKEELHLRREPKQHERIFQEVGKDNQGILDFNRPYVWNKVGEEDKGKTQQVTILFNMANFHEDFKLVKDQVTINLLMKFYSFDTHLHQHFTETESSISSLIEECCEPIIFGSFSNFAAFKMQKVAEFALITTAQKNEVRELFIKTIEAPNKPFMNLRKCPQLVYPTIKAYLASINAQVVGQSAVQALKIDASPIDKHNHGEKDSRVKDLQQKINKIFIWSGKACHGKNSVFIFEPVSQKFYVRLLVVDPQPSRSAEGYNGTLLPAYDKDPDADEDLPKLELTEAFINDINPSFLQVHQLFIGSRNQTKQPILENAMEELWYRYQYIVDLFQLLQADSPETYPTISNQALSRFCQNTGIIQDLVGSQEFGQYHKLQRTGLIRFLFWACSMSQAQGFSLKQFGAFLDAKVLLMVKNSEIAKLRSVFQNDWQLNSFVKANETYLVLAYMQLTRSFPLTYAACHEFLVSQSKVQIDDKALRRLFASSFALVLDEQQNSADYQHLNFSSFLEFLFRVSKHVFKPTNDDLSPNKKTKRSESKMSTPTIGISSPTKGKRNTIASLLLADDSVKFKEICKLTFGKMEIKNPTAQINKEKKMCFGFAEPGETTT